MSQKVIKLMLEKLGYEVVLTSNGREAEDKYRAHPSSYFSLLLLDCEMPIQNGILTAKNVRNLDSSIPIVMLTAHSTEKDKEECMEAGASDFLTKPVPTETFKKVLSNYAK
jgi:CheY-like chemotaxis protein